MYPEDDMRKCHMVMFVLLCQTKLKISYWVKQSVIQMPWLQSTTLDCNKELDFTQTETSKS